MKMCLAESLKPLVPYMGLVLLMPLEPLEPAANFVLAGICLAVNLMLLESMALLEEMFYCLFA